MILSDDALEKYRIAGRIAREVREAMKSFVREGMQIIEVCERAETLIQEKGAQPAFPCNVSVNEVAAHYTSPPRDRSIIPKNSIVKIDVGAHINGYIADTAVTICFNRQFENLVRTAEAALKVAVGTIHSGISTSRLGSTIEKTINTYGCKPVSNLTGHQIGLYLIHTGKSLPNVSHLIGSKIREGEVDMYSFTIPDETGFAFVELSWKLDWTKWATSDLDMVIIGPSGVNVEGASGASPEVTSISGPGDYTILVDGYQVYWGKKERYKLRIIYFADLGNPLWESELFALDSCLTFFRLPRCKHGLAVIWIHDSLASYMADYVVV